MNKAQYFPRTPPPSFFPFLCHGSISSVHAEISERARASELERARLGHFWELIIITRS